MLSFDGIAPQGLFTALDGDATKGLERQQVARGETLLSAGSAAEAMYLVETGRFRVERDGVELAEIGAGGVLGEIAFLTGKTRTADVIATRDSRVVRVTRADYDKLNAENPGLSVRIAAELAERLAETSARVTPDPGRPPSCTFCILPSGQSPLPEQFVPELTEAIRAYKPARVVTEADIYEALGPGADPSSPEATVWLNEQERQAGLVLFVASPEADAWSAAALRQADQVILVAQAAHFTEPSPLERQAFDLIPEVQRRLVLIHPNRPRRVTGTDRWLDSRPVFLHHHVALLEDRADIARLARFVAGQAVGLVMSGGGAFGVAHVGVWRAMEDAGLPIDIVGGTSVGSAMAGAIALGVPAQDIGPRVEEIFVTSGAMRKLTVPRYAFLDHKVLDASLQQHFTSELIEDMWLPYFAVAADLSNMKKVLIRRGPLWEAVRASSAIPGVLPPLYTADGQMLVDGGCVDNMPFRDMHGLKTGPNVVVDVQKDTSKQIYVDYFSLPGRAELLRKTLLPFGKKPPRAPGIVSSVMRSLLIGQDTARGMNPEDLHIRPPGLTGAGFLAWGQHKLFYEISYRHATEVFADLAETEDPAKSALRAAARLG